MISEKIQDAFHWLFTLFLGATGFIIDNGNEIVILCAVLSGFIQVYIQFRRARRE